jgi:FkbM family methyltransferase
MMSLVHMVVGTPLEGPARNAARLSRRWRGRPETGQSPADVRYDALTLEIARRVMGPTSCSVDIGAHWGDILKHLVEIAPEGHHFAFEPIPFLAKRLRRRFPRVDVRQLALSESPGEAEFRMVEESAAESSLFRRSEREAGRHVRLLRVRVSSLDEELPADVRPAFVKLDVEGAEQLVLAGARRVLAEAQPVVVFECASRTLPEFAFLEELGYRIAFLDDFLRGPVDRSFDATCRIASERGEYYFVAFPETASNPGGSRAHGS